MNSIKSIKSMNSTISPVLNISQEMIAELLKNYKDHNCYYAGGSLCFDVKIGETNDVLILNLNETFGLFSGERRPKTKEYR